MNQPKPPERRSARQLVPITRPRLLLRPAAFLKLTYLCHAAGTEVGGFGLSSEADLLTIEDILLVKQECTSVTVEFDDASVADLVDAMVDRGVAPNRCSRVWVHTHPGFSATPSGVDERTFARSFHGADFSVMLILARGGAFYARLQLTTPLRTAIEIPVDVDWAGLPAWLDEQAIALPGLIAQWSDDLHRLVQEPMPTPLDVVEAEEIGTAVAAASSVGRPRYWFDEDRFEDEAELLAEMEGVDDRDYAF